MHTNLIFHSALEDDGMIDSAKCLESEELNNYVPMKCKFHRNKFRNNCNCNSTRFQSEVI